VQEIEAEAEQAVDTDLPDPRDVQRNQDQSGRGDRAADDHQAVLPHPRDEKRYRQRIENAAGREGRDQQSCD
jgi:hypothetical protein